MSNLQTTLMQPRDNLKLARLLGQAVMIVKQMSPDKYERMMKAQRESWARQDHD